MEGSRDKLPLAPASAQLCHPDGVTELRSLAWAALSMNGVVPELLSASLGGVEIPLNCALYFLLYLHLWKESSS